MNTLQKMTDAYICSINQNYWSTSKVLRKIIEEANECKVEIVKNDTKKLKVEIGDLIFAICCLANSNKIELKKIDFTILANGQKTCQKVYFDEIIKLSESVLKRNFFQSSDIPKIANVSYSILADFCSREGIELEVSLDASIKKFKKRLSKANSLK